MKTPPLPVLIHESKKTLPKKKKCKNFKNNVNYNKTKMFTVEDLHYYRSVYKIDR